MAIQVKNSQRKTKRSFVKLISEVQARVIPVRKKCVLKLKFTWSSHKALLSDETVEDPPPDGVQYLAATNKEQVWVISPRQNVFLSFVADLCRSSFE